MTVQPLDQQRVTAHYDPERRVAYIVYSGILEATDSAAAYAWLNAIIEEIGVEHLHGEIFDFRAVKQFQSDNLIDARKNSRRLNLRVDIHQTPVAMIVRDQVQEEILRGPMRNVRENRRKRIVLSEDEAYAFFTEWHSTLKSDPEEETLDSP